MHNYTASITLNELNIAADSCCNTQGAQHGTYTSEAGTNGGVSGLPFTQLILCAVQSGVANNGSIPFGGVGYFDPDVADCPKNWIPFTEAEGLQCPPRIGRDTCQAA